METARVHIAVLSIADPSAAGGEIVALENIVADGATSAGHQIAAFETVRDSETAIRAALLGCIEDDDIDVVIVVGDGEHTSAALKPLLDQSLPGFADLLRMLAYQEIGASAMLSSAEAARCKSTFVFVLPAGEGAVRAAMEKLILPQLDPKTRPRNLVSSIPRLRADADVTKADLDVTRVDISTTQSDVTRVDTTPVATRMRSPTGKNVIVRQPPPSQQPQRPPTKVDDPTKPIPLQSLERQLELSKNSGPDATKPLDIGKPAVSKPQSPVIAGPKIKTPAQPSEPARPQVKPAARVALETRPLEIDPKKPAPTLVVVDDEPSTRVRQPTPARPIGVATGAPPATRPGQPTPARPFGPLPSIKSGPSRPADTTSTPPPTPPPAARSSSTATPPTAVPTPANWAATSKTASPWVSPATPAPTSTSTSPFTSAPASASSSSESASTSRSASTSTSPSPFPSTSASTSASRSASPSSPSMSRPSASTPASTSTTPIPSTTSASPSVSTSRSAAPSPPSMSSPSGSTPASTSTTPIPSTTSASRSVSTSPPTSSFPAAPASLETADASLADIESSAAEAAPAVAALVEPEPVPVRSRPPRPPTPPPPPPLAESTISDSDIIPIPSTITGPELPARRSSVSDLPQGAFVYPPDLKPSKTPLLIVLLLAAAAIGAVLYFVVLKRDETPAATPPPSETLATAPPTTPPSETTQPAPAPVEVDAGIDEAAIDIEPEPDAAVTPTTTTTPSRPTRARPTRATTTRPPDRTESEEPKSADPEEPKQAEAPLPRTNDDPACDEVGCILEKYARPCCAKYKPADTGFQARSSESLTKPQIKAGVDRVRPRVIDCGQKHPAKGTVKVGVSVNGAGEVEGVSVKEAPDGALGECVADAMRRAQFAKTANGGSFTYPFVF